MTIHKRIKQRREELGMSMQALATACGYSSWQTVQQWEKEDHEGGTAPKRSKLQLVAKVLETSAEWLTTGKMTEEKTAISSITDLAALEVQLVTLYRMLKQEQKDALLLFANEMATGNDPEKTGAHNPFPNKGRRRTDKYVRDPLIAEIRPLSAGKRKSKDSDQK